jgi:hypothetical protein
MYRGRSGGNQPHALLDIYARPTDAQVARHAHQAGHTVVSSHTHCLQEGAVLRSRPRFCHAMLVRAALSAVDTYPGVFLARIGNAETQGLFPSSPSTRGTSSVPDQDRAVVRRVECDIARPDRSAMTRNPEIISESPMVHSRSLQSPTSATMEAMSKPKASLGRNILYSLNVLTAETEPVTDRSVAPAHPDTIRSLGE